MSKSEVAQTFGVSLSSVKRYVAMARERRPLTPKKRTALRPKIDELFLNAESSCSAWRECELATRRSPGQ
jgi:transposase